MLASGLLFLAFVGLFHYYQGKISPGKRLKSLDDSIKCVVINFENTFVVDHTVLDKLHAFANRWDDRELVLAGLEEHRASSDHHLAARRRIRERALA